MVAKSPNRLLAALPAKTFAAVQAHLKIVELKLGDVVAEAGSAVSKVYFPYSGAVSLVVELAAGATIETAMVGRTGAVNAAAALDGKVSLNKAIVQVAGTAAAIDVDRLRKIADEFAALRSVLIRHEQVLFAQSQQSAACNATHSLEARLSRWILHMRDLAGSDELTLTQDFLARMLGAKTRIAVDLSIPSGPSRTVISSCLHPATLALRQAAINVLRPIARLSGVSSQPR